VSFRTGTTSVDSAFPSHIRVSIISGTTLTVIRSGATTWNSPPAKPLLPQGNDLRLQDTARAGEASRAVRLAHAWLCQKPLLPFGLAPALIVGRHGREAGEPGDELLHALGLGPGEVVRLFGIGGQVVEFAASM
jgi:hypothetical protein